MMGMMGGAGGQQNTLTIEVPASCTGLIIGKKGAEIKKMQTNYGVKCEIPKANEIHGQTARITITGRDVNGCGERIQQLCGNSGQGSVQIVGGTGGGGGAIGGFSSPGAGAAGPKLKEHLASTQEHTAAITGLLIMGSDLYSSGKDGQIIVWAYSGTTLTVKHKVPTSGPAECLLAAEPYLFAGVPGGVQCWNMTTNASQNMEHPPLVHCLATCPVPNGAPMLLSGGADGGIRIWKNNPQSGQWEGVTQLTGHNGPVMSLSISNNAVPGTSLVVSGGQDNTCRLWVPQNPNAPVQTLTEAQGWVMGALEMQLSTGVYLCTGSLDTKVKVYQYQAGNNVSPFTAFFEHEVHKSVQESGMQVEQGACQVTAMLLTEDSQGTQVLATALTGGVIMVWDVPTFEKRDQVMCGPPNMSIALMALPKQLLIAGAGNGQVFMWQWG